MVEGVGPRRPLRPAARGAAVAVGRVGAKAFLGPPPTARRPGPRLRGRRKPCSPKIINCRGPGRRLPAAPGGGGPGAALASASRLPLTPLARRAYFSSRGRRAHNQLFFAESFARRQPAPAPPPPQVKPIQFLPPPAEEFAFGLAKPPQPEGAREGAPARRSIFILFSLPARTRPRVACGRLALRHDLPRLQLIPQAAAARLCRALQTLQTVRAHLPRAPAKLW